MNCSIMVVTYNRLELTKRALESLFNTTANYRLIVVDNGSTDGTTTWLKTMKKERQGRGTSVDLYFNKDNMGIAVGRNQGLQIADQHNDPWLATIDNDVEFPDGWLDSCLDIISANTNFSIGVNMEDVEYPLLTKNEKTFQLKKQGNLGSACMVFPRRLHSAIGFFTTEYEKYGEEDADWGFRTRIAGYQLGYITTKGIHFGVGELDTGEYRKFKDDCRTKNIAKFHQNCRAYMSRQKSIVIPYKVPLDVSQVQ